MPGQFLAKWPIIPHSVHLSVGAAGRRDEAGSLVAVLRGQSGDRCSGLAHKWQAIRRFVMSDDSQEAISSGSAADQLRDGFMASLHLK